MLYIFSGKLKVLLILFFFSSPFMSPFIVEPIFTILQFCEGYNFKVCDLYKYSNVVQGTGESKCQVNKILNW